MGEAAFPFSEDAERSVLGAILVEGENITEIKHLLASSDFYLPAHQAIFTAMLALTLAGQPVDMLTVHDRLELDGMLAKAGGAPAISKLVDGIPKLVNVKHYAKIILDRSTRRQAMKLADAYSREISSGDMIAEATSKLTSALAVTCHVALEEDASTMSKLADAYLVDLADRMDGVAKDDYIPTDFKSLDGYLTGFRRPSFVIVAGDTSQGKTSLASCLMLNVASKGHGSLFLSLEMTAKQLTERLIATLAKVNSMALSNASKERQLTEVQWRSLENAMARVKSLQLVIDENIRSVTIHSVRSKIAMEKQRRSLARLPPLEVVVVDYLQLMTGPEHREYDRLSSITRGLKLAAMEENVVLIALSQLSRAERDSYKLGVRPRPGIHELRGTGTIEQDADVILLVHRPEYYLIKSGQEPGGWSGKAEVIIGKNRFGDVAITQLGFRKEWCLFHDL